MELNEFKTRRSTGIMVMYWSIIVFFVFMMLGVPYFAREEMKDNEQIIFYVVFSILLVAFLWLIYRIYTMKYVIEQDELKIYGAFNVNKVKIYEIEEIKRTPIPYAFRLYGGTFIGGRYYIPGVGKAWVAMTNFTDGVMISTQKGEHYVITPINPDDFIDTIKRRL